MHGHQARDIGNCAQDDGEEECDEPKDIELVMTQAPVSWLKAVKAADGDIVSAIMELTN
ncbi:Nascent polypeptide-associated complex subunit alpha-like protein [Carex littledalei]|uniref:Nascent polypeptide-associated complex subunit alpha-like protein n=1 Tax=Carex littledalei TaxID=544730 RepID=A0A833VYE8_9POAL|nr:Nascent polypeptide-associated complex subunit alpha-like protein [Carex littledalei]